MTILLPLSAIFIMMSVLFLSSLIALNWVGVRFFRVGGRILLEISLLMSMENFSMVWDLGGGVHVLLGVNLGRVELFSPNSKASRKRLLKATRSKWVWMIFILGVGQNLSPLFNTEVCGRVRMCVLRL